MTAATITEKDIVLRLFKDFTIPYNPSSIASTIRKSRYGAFKALKDLEADGIVKGRNYGKARFYTIDYDEEYALKNVETLLMEEAKKYRRWHKEYKALASHCDIIILFGSLLQTEKEAKDIDLLLVFEEKNNQKINEIVKEKNEILTKRMHLMKQTPEDIRKNITNHDKPLLDALRTGVVLHGFENYVRLVKECHKQANTWNGA